MTQSELHLNEISPAGMLNVRKTDPAMLGHAGLTGTEWSISGAQATISAVKALTIWHGVICSTDQNGISLLILGSALF